jgi:hypothetical protein
MSSIQKDPVAASRTRLTACLLGALTGWTGCAADVRSVDDVGIEPYLDVVDRPDDRATEDSDSGAADVAMHDVADEADGRAGIEQDVEVGKLVFAPSDPKAATGESDDGKRVWRLEAVDDDMVLRLEIYEAFGGPVSPDVVEITAVETNYATCGTCVVFQTGCVAHDDHFDCDRTFMPREGGQIALTSLGAVGAQLTGGLVSLGLQEVTIGADYETQVVSDGDTLDLDDWSFDVLLDAFGEPDVACGGHGELHGDHCHCDPGYGLDPEDPTLCIPE